MTEQHLCFILMGKKVNWEIQHNFLWLFCEYLNVCHVQMFACVFVYWLNIYITYRYLFSLLVWCGEKLLLIYLVVRQVVCACARLIRDLSRVNWLSFLLPPHMFCHVVLLFFLFLLLDPHFHILASSLLATISLGLHLPSFTARSPWNPPRTINIVWKRSLGKHEPKGLSISHIFSNDSSHCEWCRYTDISFTLTVIGSTLQLSNYRIIVS